MELMILIRCGTNRKALTLSSSCATLTHLALTLLFRLPLLLGFVQYRFTLAAHATVTTHKKI